MKRVLSMLVHQAEFTVDLGESGYLIGFTEHDDYPDEMPYGWRCGPAGPSSAVVLPTTDTGPLQLTIQIHDSQPAVEASSEWEPAEEISLLAETDSIHLATLDPGEVSDAWPEDYPLSRCSPCSARTARCACACTAMPTTPNPASATTENAT
ncbi:hypothetical protein [Streptomyces sp. EAS-AB2608]|uniref:hypothetical protein n=1 Tax=Streptomyces sp. EAS-AB2608 TaxID=2779671 RepID=UPI0021A3C241|nr:hypothetical protein [Streptomyces sp. EAS-AB2608]